MAKQRPTREQKDRYNAAQAKRRRDRIKAGLCVVCQDPARPRTTKCDRCHARQAEWAQPYRLSAKGARTQRNRRVRQYWECVELGICVNCQKFPRDANVLTCPDCHAKQIARHRSALRPATQKRGCKICGGPGHDRRTCPDRPVEVLAIETFATRRDSNAQI